MQFTTFCGMKIDWNIFKFIIQFECIALFDCTKRRRKKWYPLTQISRSSCIQSSIHHTAICLPTIKTMGIHTSKLIHKNVRFCCDNRFELWLWSVLISIHLLLFWLSFVLNAQQLLQLMQFAKRCHCYCDVSTRALCELSTPQEKRHRTSIIDDNRIN